MPSLPLQLERQIFEIAALQDINHNSRVRLMLVAKRVYEWILPSLYRVVTIVDARYSLRKTPSLLTTLNWRNAQVTNTPHFVQNLLLETRKESLILEILSAFPNIENLAIWGLTSVSSEVLKKMGDLPLRMLAVGADTGLDQILKNRPAFKNLTHLEILSCDRPTSVYDVLIGLPKLTHLCLSAPVYITDATVLDLLEHCASLRVLVLRMFTGAGYVDLTITTLDDPRYMILMGREDLMEEWERSANGLIGGWELAEIIVDARKGNFFKDGSPSLFSRKTWMEHLNEDGMRWYEEWSGRFRNGV